MPIQSANHRPLRSFVRREGRITTAQQRALDQWWPQYGLSATMPLQLSCFPSDQPLVLEIGFGMGQSFVQMACDNPHENYIGIEVHRPGVGAVLAEIEKQQLANIRLYQDDATLVCREAIPAGSLSRIQIFFPDPWPKKRHHKRRLVQSPFMALLASRLMPGGILHLATDVDSYAEHMIDVMAKEPLFESGPALEALSYQRPSTKFERAGLVKGHRIHDLIYQRSEQ